MTPFRIALLLAVLCGVAAWQVSVIPESLMQMTVGPTLVPAVVVGGLAVLALVYGVSAWRGRQSDESLAEDQSALPGANTRLLSLLAGGVAFMALVGIMTGTILGLARAFDAPMRLKYAIVCGAIATAFWVLFAHILGVGLGPGLPWLI